MTSPELSDRARILLKALIESYISEGQPVASGVLARASGLSVSPATVRNVMADLEAQGYIASPHTSAGRVPTARGYRLFVNALMSYSPPAVDELSSLNADLSSKELVRSASTLLSQLTRQAGVVMLPRGGEPVLRHVEFLPLGGERVLVVLVLDTQEVQNRIIHTREPYSREALQRASNYINEVWAGEPLSAIREGIVRALASDRARIDALMQSVVDMAEQALRPEASAPDYVVSGETHLMAQANADNLSGLRGLFEAFENKRDILHLMDRCVEADGVQIFIGEESGYQVLDDYSVVTAPYRAGNRSLGVLGVIGPTRMAYERVVPIVDLTARMLGAALTRQQNDPA